MNFTVQLHKVIGLACGLWFALLAVTGLLLAFKDDALSLYAGAFPHVTETEPTDFSQIYMQHGLQDCALLRIDKHTSTVLLNPAYETICDGVRGLLNSYGEMIKGGSTVSAFFDFIFRFHLDLLIPQGRYIQAVAGLLLLIMIYTGCYVWLKMPGRPFRKLYFKKKAPLPRRYFEIHRAFGGWLALPSLLIFFCGTILTVAGLVPVKTVTPQPSTTYIECMGAVQCMAWWHEIYPDEALISIRVSKSDDMVRFLSHTEGGLLVGPKNIISLQPSAGLLASEVTTANRTAWGTFTAWMYPLHTGKAFPYVGKISVFFIGTAYLILMGYGVAFWFRKRKMHR